MGYQVDLSDIVLPSTYADDARQLLKDVSVGVRRTIAFGNPYQHMLRPCEVPVTNETVRIDKDNQVHVSFLKAVDEPFDRDECCYWNLYVVSDNGAIYYELPRMTSNGSEREARKIGGKHHDGHNATIQLACGMILVH